MNMAAYLVVWALLTAILFSYGLDETRETKDKDGFVVAGLFAAILWPIAGALLVFWYIGNRLYRLTK